MIINRKICSETDKDTAKGKEITETCCRFLETSQTKWLKKHYLKKLSFNIGYFVESLLKR